MDFLSGNNKKTTTQQSGSGGGIMDTLHGAVGGGPQSEQKEDFLDKGVDFAQERLGQGQQSNENAVEQAKDEQISDAIRRGYKGTTGSEFPVADK